MDQQMQPSPAPAREIPDDEIDLRDIILVVWRYRWFIAGVFLVSVLAAGIISFATAPVYEVRTVIDLGRYQSVVYTSPPAVKELITSDDFLWQVVRQLRLDVAEEDFKGFKESIKAEQVKGTNMLSIVIETADRAEGKAVLGKMVELLQNRSRPDFERHRRLLTEQLETVKARLADVEKSIAEARANLAAVETAPGLSRSEKDFRRSQILEALQGFEGQRTGLLDRYLGLQKELNGLEHVTVIENPREPVYPVKPNKKLNIALAGVLGLMIGVLGAFVIEFFRRNPLPRAGGSECT